MAQHIGERLQQARQDRSISLEKAARDTYIRLHYLQSLEAGKLAELPSQAQARGFLRAYASYLGLDGDELLASLRDAPTRPPPASTRQAIAPSGTIQPDAQAAGTIFKELGESLRRQRELLGFSLEDVEQHTHLRIHYLQALEDGELDILPSPVQGRGMLSNYANFLGLDPDPILLRFAEGLQARLAARHAARGRPRSPTVPRGSSGLRRLVSADLIFGGLLILSLIIFVIWGVVRITSTQAEAQAPPTAPPIAQVLLPTPAPTATPTQPSPAASPVSDPGDPANELESTPEDTIPDLGPGAVQVYIVIRQRAWMRVLVDGQVEFEGRVVPGSAYPFVGDETVEILTGNAAGLQIYYNQQDLGTLGIMGEIANTLFSADGIVLPTPSITPTASATPPATPTPASPGTPEGSPTSSP